MPIFCLPEVECGKAFKGLGYERSSYLFSCGTAGTKPLCSYSGVEGVGWVFGNWLGNEN